MEWDHLLEKIKSGTFTEKCLKLSDQDLIDDQVVYSCEVLKSSKNQVTEIQLADNAIGDDGAIALASVPGLKRLNLSGNTIKSAGVKAIAESKLESADLSYNLVRDEDLKAFEGNSTLRELNINNNFITAQGFSHLRKTKITALIACNMFIGNQAVEALSSSAENDTLPFTSLHLSQDDIDDQSIPFLMKNRSLTTLHLFLNHIGPKGAALLAEHPSLTDVDLGHNQLDDAAAKKLASMPKLTALDLSGNKNIKNPENVMLFFANKKPLVKLKIDHCAPLVELTSSSLTLG